MIPGRSPCAPSRRGPQCDACARPTHYAGRPVDWSIALVDGLCAAYLDRRGVALFERPAPVLRVLKPKAKNAHHVHANPEE